MPRKLSPFEPGMRVGRLLVLGEAPRLKGNRAVFVRCDCGTERSVQTANLKPGNTISCGCLKRERTQARNFRHGLTRLPEYRVWSGIIKRCTNPGAVGFKNYGGRGIRICDLWRASFQAFFEHVGPRPSPKHSIDRIDNAGDYEPGNCRWATRAEQNTNYRRNVWLTHDGRTMIVADWAAETGIDRRTITDRLKRSWSVEKVLTTPPDRKYRPRPGPSRAS